MDRLRTLTVARLGTVDYTAALGLQNALAASRYRGEIGDTLLLLEHPHVFTLGRGADARYLLRPRPEVPVYRVSRGGQITYHGPGQIVGYPIIKLEGAARDVIRYLRMLEQAMIDALAAVGVTAARRDGLTGVWVGPHKIASIGVGLRRWVTLHGFALNVTPDLSYFDAIVPCGIDGCRMCSIAALGHPEISVGQFAAEIERSFISVFGYTDMAAANVEELWRHVDCAAPACEALRSYESDRLEK